MRYVSAQSAKAASEALIAEPGTARVLAGGTDLLVQMKSGNPSGLIWWLISRRSPEFGTSSPRARRFACWRSGGQVQNCGEHAAVVARCGPAWSRQLGLIGSTQVQGRCTMVGQPVQRLARRGFGAGTGGCRRVARIEGPEGVRDCAGADIPAGPGRTTLKKGEIVTSVLLPARPARSGDAYLRFIPRTEMDIAVASAAVNLTLDAGGTDKRRARGFGGSRAQGRAGRCRRQGDHRHQA